MFCSAISGLPKACRVARVGDGVGDHALERRDRHDRDDRALVGQLLHQVVEALALAEARRDRDAAVLEVQLAGVLRVLADLVQRLARA